MPNSCSAGGPLGDGADEELAADEGTLPGGTAAAGWLVLVAPRSGARRQVIAEERAWRTARSRRWGYRPVVAGLAPSPTARSGRTNCRPIDTSTDNPASEASCGQLERAILTVYWLVSGLRPAGLASAGLAGAVTAGFEVAFHLAGFTRPPQPVSYWTSLLYAFRATLSLTDSQAELTAWGKLLQALLRLTGPVLFGLTLLVIRARTKR